MSFYRQRLILLGALLGMCFGCSVHQLTGDTMTGYTREHLIPYKLEQGSLDSACALGLAMGGFLNSFERVIESPHRAAVPTLVSASMCFEEAAWQHELAYLRAIRDGKPELAMDARIRQQIAHRKVAQTLKTAYERTIAIFGEPSAERCPDLQTEEDDQLWLMGMVSGIQAVRHDGAAERTAGVSMDLPIKAMRGVRCLDNNRWWGTPKALEAAIWVSVPGSQPTSGDASEKTPYQVIEDNLKLAEKSPIKMVFAVAAMVYENAGDEAMVKRMITRYGKSEAAGPGAHRKRLLGLHTRRQLRAASDRIWMKTVGHRTPVNKLGEIPQETKNQETSEDDDLLNDI